MGAKITKQEFVDRARLIHGNKYEYSGEYLGSSVKMEIVCNIHGSYMQVPYSHLSGSGCYQCSIFNRGLKRKKTHQQFVDEANAIHNYRYQYIGEYMGALSTQEFLCKIHGSFFQTPSDHLNSNGCAKCSHSSGGLKRKKTQQQFIDQCSLVHGNKYTYPDLYVGVKNILLIICNTCNLNFYQTPDNHLQGSGCPNCANVFNATTKRKSIPKLIEGAIKVHGNKYDYSEVNALNYINKDTKIPIKCNDCNSLFYQTPGNHINNGNGCRVCHIKIQTGSTKSFIEKAINVHGNDKYDYSNVEYTLCRNKVKIICNSCTKIFSQNPFNHLQGQGCPRCCSKIISKVETDWLNYLDIPLEYRQKSLKINNKLIKADAYDPTTNTIYEFNGDFWHGNPKVYNIYEINIISKKSFGQLYEATLNKETMIKSAGYNLVSIWENDWKEIVKTK